jgi:hypothetical protein
MARSFCVLLASLAAVSLMLLALTVEPMRPWYAASTREAAAVPAVVNMPDPAATALDDLAAWPAAAGR